MRVLVAMSGGVDSSVAAALLVEKGHEVTGATMKLWGGDSDSGCCSVSDVEDARRVAAQLGIAHHVFNFTEDFDARVVEPYVEGHRRMRTPNPCIECNRHLKFDRFLARALRLGFDAIATGHHARIDRAPSGMPGAGGAWRLRRGVDPAKDQSYVLSMLGQDQLARILFPIGEMTKEEVRRRAAEEGLRTATKPDSQDVCFITAQAGRDGFLRARLTMTPGRLVDGATGEEAGQLDALELVTIGQRRGIGRGPSAERRYVTEVDPAARTARIGGYEQTLTGRVRLSDLAFTDQPIPDGTAVLAQMSAHGLASAATLETSPPAIAFDLPQRRVAPGQTVAFFDGDVVLGCGIATANE